MICSSVNRLVFMSIILHVDGLHFVQLGTASGGQVNLINQNSSLLRKLYSQRASAFGHWWLKSTMK